MMFADVHMHALYGVDDGAKTEEDMRAIIDCAYEDGARFICFTPHFHPGYYGNNKDAAEKAFSIASEYVKSKYSDLRLALGNELHYAPGCESWIAEGMFKTMNGTRLLLVDFSESERKRNIETALHRLQNAGYTPILAHAERYSDLSGDINFIKQCKENGIFIQIDTQSLFGDFGWKVKRFCKMILSKRLADIVSSDAHDLDSRPPGITKAYEYIRDKYGEGYAHAVCGGNAAELIFNCDNIDS